MDFLPKYWSLSSGVILASSTSASVRRRVASREVRISSSITLGSASTGGLLSNVVFFCDKRYSVMSAASWSLKRRLGIRVFGEKCFGFLSQVWSQSDVTLLPRPESSGPCLLSAKGGIAVPPTVWHATQPSSVTSFSPFFESPESVGFLNSTDSEFLTRYAAIALMAVLFLSLSSGEAVFER